MQGNGVTGELELTRAKLTPKQLRFIEEYLIDLNATQAAVRAGYSRDTARVIGSENLSKPDIAGAIAARQKERTAKAELTAADVAAELAKIGFANMADYFFPGDDGDPHLDFSKLTREQTAALCEVTVAEFKEGRGKDARDVRRVKFKLADKRAALVDLAKMNGWIVDRQEVSHQTKVISDQPMSPSEWAAKYADGSSKSAH